MICCKRAHLLRNESSCQTVSNMKYKQCKKCICWTSGTGTHVTTDQKNRSEIKTGNSENNRKNSSVYTLEIKRGYANVLIQAHVFSLPTKYYKTKTLPTSSAYCLQFIGFELEDTTPAPA